MGFVYGTNLINNNTGAYRITRPRWKPKFMRQIDPGFYVDAYHRASDGKFQQAELTLFPIWIIANRGNRFTGNVIPTWQVVDEAFPIVGITIPTGNYYYTRYRFSYDSDLSRAFSVKTLAEFGSFYNGQLATLQGEARYSPLPNVSVKVAYQRNNFRDVGETSEWAVTHLITPEIRLSLNPRLQLTSFF